MYWFAKRKLEENRYIHYEISNFAKPGYYCRHNVDCWNQKEYFGFGVAASSYFDKKRFDLNKIWLTKKGLDFANVVWEEFV